ncbi:hypothetical protein [Nonomuraea sp. SYSU D8015]|uniref:hypothetical protein n=1 Tax=Nonomuraea sp. SYSU D8015 TaxID=2593644 RepID=UPI0016601D77|nr:hypothetical protein [Nonomuraea sp. SYSU D8015]
MKLRFRCEIRVDRDRWMDWHADGKEDLDIAIGHYISAGIDYLPGFCDTDAIIRRWGGSKPQTYEWTLEVSAASWESWAGIRPGRTRRDIIDYTTYAIPWMFAGLEQTKADVIWHGVTPVDYSTPEKRHELLWRWPTSRSCDCWGS